MSLAFLFECRSVFKSICDFIVKKTSILLCKYFFDAVQYVWYSQNNLMQTIFEIQYIILNSKQMPELPILIDLLNKFIYIIYHINITQDNEQVSVLLLFLIKFENQFLFFCIMITNKPLHVYSLKHGKSFQIRSAQI